MEHCPLCGGELCPKGEQFTNQKRHADQNQSISRHFGQFEVLLDNLRSTLNVGSIFRTADGVGINHIYCCGTTPTPEHAKIAKTSLGAEGFTHWSYAANAFELVMQKKQAGSQIISLEATETSQSLFDPFSFSTGNPLLLVIGNEVSGVDPEILQNSDNVFYIPMRGKKSSLNVAVAFGIAAYRLFN